MQHTFERLFSMLKTEYVEHCIVEHGKGAMDVMKEKQIAIDDKKECGTAQKCNYLLHA